MNMKNYDEAVSDFQRVLEVDSGNKAAKNQLAVAKHHIRQQREKEKQTYAGMFTKFAELDAKVSTLTKRLCFELTNLKED